MWRGASSQPGHVATSCRPASPPPARGARLGRVARRPSARGAGVGDLSQRWHGTPSTVCNALRHYATPRANAPPVLEPILANPIHRGVSMRAPPGPIVEPWSRQQVGDAWTAFTTPSRTLRGTASQHRHKPRHDRREPLSDTGRAGQRDDSSGTSGTVNGDEDAGRPQPPILASSRPRPATADCNIVATALGVTSSERTPQTSDASPTKVEAPSGTPVSPRRLAVVAVSPIQRRRWVERR